MKVLLLSLGGIVAIVTYLAVMIAGYMSSINFPY